MAWSSRVILALCLVLSRATSGAVIARRGELQANDVNIKTQHGKATERDKTSPQTRDLESNATLNTLLPPHCYEHLPLAVTACEELLHRIHGEPYYVTTRHWAVPHDSGILKSWRNDWCIINLIVVSPETSQIHDDFSYKDVLASAARVMRSCVVFGRSGLAPTGHGVGFFVNVHSPVNQPPSGHLLSNASANSVPSARHAYLAALDKRSAHLRP